MIDNYDSFTYNLVHQLGEQGVQVLTYRNDRLNLDTIRSLSPDLIVLSPGPSTPDKVGITVEAIKAFAGKIPIFGVCLGHQAIGYAFGARIATSCRLLHGKVSEVHHNSTGLFKGIPQAFKACRYHSLIVERESLPPEFQVTATSSDGEVMAMRHKSLPIFGVQFHPEAVLTEHGDRLIENLLSCVKNGGRA
jgi:anthranilate synthase/aminodeoxychorismate synthase-like glutamine amidotransferase